MQHEFLKVDIESHIASVAMDRPPVNALNAPMMEEMYGTFQSIATDWDVRVVILSSTSDRVWCGGADIKDMSQRQLPPPTDSGKVGRDAMWAILDCPVPVIASVNGPALGGGLAFAACCDIIVASERALFGCPEVDVGLLGAGSHLHRMVGPYRMRELYYTGRRVPAKEMYEFGGISRVVAHDRLREETRAIASEIARKSPPAIRLAKEALTRVEHLPLREAYRTEQDYTARLRAYDDSKEAMQAFLEKREPNFRGC